LSSAQDVVCRYPGKKKETVSKNRLPGEGYWAYSCVDIFDAYIPKNILLLEDPFEKYLPKYVPAKEAGGMSVEKDLLAF
jgi:hypothetical protein